jgi:hypothetical protein
MEQTLSNGRKNGQRPGVGPALTQIEKAVVA